MMAKGKEFAIGPIRAKVTEKDGMKTIRLSGRINVRKGQRGQDLTQYEAQALWNWLGYNAFDSTPSGGTEHG